jgi:uncharacterized protein YjaZ
MSISVSKTEKIDLLMGYLYDNPQGVSYVAGYLEGIIRDHMTEKQIDIILEPIIIRGIRSLKGE